MVSAVLSGMIALIGAFLGTLIATYVLKTAQHKEGRKKSIIVRKQKRTESQQNVDIGSTITNTIPQLLEYQKAVDADMKAYKQKQFSRVTAEIENRARELTTLAIQRCASEVVNEFTVTTVKVPNEEIKGRLIGKAGRNIQWLEKTIGVELLIDDTPGVITISGFSSVRRYIAKRTIEKLITDGRIHPSLIEEMYQKASREVDSEIVKAGQWAVDELGIIDFNTELIAILGRLTFRTGYGQNILKHSVEMARLAGLIADGINGEFIHITPVDRMICVKGALLHDIGKALDEDMTPKGNHIEIGEQICDIYGLDWRIKKCISSHHTTGGDRESYYDKNRAEVCLEAAIVDACDSISGARPGARKEDTKSYFDRVTAIETLTGSILGVSKTWVMRGAKEVWVFYDADTISSDTTERVTQQIAQKIQDTITTPQEIKVVGIREDRVVTYSR